MGPKLKPKRKKKKDGEEDDTEGIRDNNEEVNNGDAIFGNSPEMEFTAVISVPPQVVSVRRRPLWLFQTFSQIWFVVCG